MAEFTSGGGAYVAETVLFATAKSYDWDWAVTREDSFRSWRFFRACVDR